MSNDKNWAVAGSVGEGGLGPSVSAPMLKELLNNTSAVVYMKDLDGKYLFVNREFESLFKLTSAQIIGKVDRDIFPNDVADAFRVNDVRALDAPRAIQMEETAPTEDGVRTYVSVKFAMRDANRQAYATAGISTDITEEKRANQQVAATQRLLNDAFKRVTDAFVALDTQWTYTYVNVRAGEIFNRKPEDLIGKHIWTEFPEGVGQPFHLAYERALAEQQPVHFENYFEPYDRWFENIVYPSPQGLSIYFHDITSRKKSEQSLHEERGRLEEAVRERTAELSEQIDQMRRFALLTADRELRIQELRHENDELRRLLNLAAPNPGANP